MSNIGGSQEPLTVTGAGGGSNPAAGTTGSGVPTYASYGGLNISGNLTGITGFSVGSQVAQAVAIVDASGNQITNFGGGTQYTDGATQATPTGTVALGKNPSNVLHALSLDASGNLNVSVGSSITSLPSVTIGTWSAGTLTIAGSVTFASPQHVIVDSATLGTVTISGSVSFSSPQHVIIDSATLGTVTISGSISFTAPQHVIIDSATLGTVTVSGSVSVSSGTVTADILGGGGATLDSAAGTPNSQALTVQGNASGVPIPVSGSIGVTNFPATFAVTQGTALWVDQLRDEFGNKATLTEWQTLFQLMLTELRAIRLGTQNMIPGDDLNLIELAQELYDEDGHV